MATRTLDIMEVLREIDNRNQTFYDDLPSETQKGFAPVVVMRWTTGSKSEYRLLATNEYVNKYVFALYKHPGLLYKLMAGISEGGRKRYNWLGVKSKAGNDLKAQIVADYYKWSKRQALQYLSYYTPDDIATMAKELGYQMDVIKKIK